MKKEDVERAIKDGVENAAASIVSDEIANAIMSGDLQKDELSVSKDDDKHQDMQNEEKSSDKQDSSDQGKSQDDTDEQKNKISASLRTRKSCCEHTASWKKSSRENLKSSKSLSRAWTKTKR